MIQKLNRFEILLPSYLDVLFHLPETRVLRDEGYVMAHAIQYGLCSKGLDEAKAFERLAHEIISKCNYTVSRGICPDVIAADKYLKAFFKGEKMIRTKEIRAIEEDLIDSLRSQFRIRGGSNIDIEMRICSICKMQRQSGYDSLEAFIDAA